MGGRDRRNQSIFSVKIRLANPTLARRNVGGNFAAGDSEAPGTDPEIITVASAYQSATRHRVPPPAFGSLPREERISRR